MGLASIIRAGLQTVKSITGGTDGLLADVEHEAFSSASAYGAVTYDTAVTRQALVEYKPTIVRTTGGEEKLSKANLMFVEPVTIDPRDRFTLPDGTVAPILSLSTVVDPSTGKGYYQQVFL